jgi:hypothetical protein
MKPITKITEEVGAWMMAAFFVLAIAQLVQIMIQGV